MLFPYQRGIIFTYPGENDVASGKTEEYVAQEFTKLWILIRQKLPSTEINFMLIKPGFAKAKYADGGKKANALISKYLRNKQHSLFIDMNTGIYKPRTFSPDCGLFRLLIFIKQSRL